MVGETVKQTRCTTCDADHEYKHATVPRQRKKDESALYSQVLAAVTPRKVVPSREPVIETEAPAPTPPPVTRTAPAPPPPMRGGIADFDALFEPADPPVPVDSDTPVEEGPLHRRLIRAQLPRHEGQVSTTRQAPDFTIRQPNPGRPNRFGGARAFRGGAAAAQSNRQGGGGNSSSNGNGNARGGQRHSGRQSGPRPGANRQGGGRNRSK
jgi:hypothetical protein